MDTLEQNAVEKKRAITIQLPYYNGGLPQVVMKAIMADILVMSMVGGNVIIKPYVKHTDCTMQHIERWLVRRNVIGKKSLIRIFSKNGRLLKEGYYNY